MANQEEIEIGILVTLASYSNRTLHRSAVLEHVEIRRITAFLLVICVSAQLKSACNAGWASVYKGSTVLREASPRPASAVQAHRSMSLPGG